MANYRKKSTHKTRGGSRKRTSSTRRSHRVSHSRRNRRPIQSGG